MKTTTFLLVLLISTVSLFAQNSNQKYDVLIRKADSLYQVKDYKNSALAFSDAFNVPDSKITINHRYNAACSYALANNADRAFANLNYIATLMNYTRYGHIKTDPDLKSLYPDRRWEPIHTEISRKYTPEKIQEMAERSGFKVVAPYFDMNGFYCCSLCGKK